MSLAERDLRRLQQALQDALAKGAPDAEIDELMQRAAAGARPLYAGAGARACSAIPTRRPPRPTPRKLLTARDLQRMLDRARELARSGARDEARELLSQLQNMLENLRAARPAQMQQRGASQAQQMMRGLQELMQRQQQLLDRSFRAQRQQGQQNRNGQPGQQPGQRKGQQPGQQPGDERPIAVNRARWATPPASRRRCAACSARSCASSAREWAISPQPFGRAERAMRDATGALQRGQPGEAIGPQTEALDQLQQAARDFAQAAPAAPRQHVRRPQWRASPDRPAAIRATGADRDPFGRPMSNNGTFDQGDVKIPDANILQKSRQILDELRRRAGERSRPRIELDYIDRLLKRF